MESRRLIAALGRKFPRRYAESFDFPGRQIGRLAAETKRVLVALDYDRSLLSITAEFKPDLVITHHPFIFGTPAKVFKNDPDRRALSAEFQRITAAPIYSFHTNFDAAPGGMNDIFAALLQLSRVYTPAAEPCMRIGYLHEAMDLFGFADYLLERTKATYATLIPAGKKAVQKIGLVAGGGSSMYRAAMDEGCDVYVSGDIPHHVRRDIVNSAFDYVDLPHEIERMFVPAMKKILLDLDPELTVLAVDHEKEALVRVRAQ